MNYPLWNENPQSVHNLENFAPEYETKVNDIIKDHHQLQPEILEEYFKEYMYNLKESVIELSCDGDFRIEFNKLEFGDFSYSIRKSHFFKFHSQPPTSVKLNSAILVIINILRNELNFWLNLRLKLTTTDRDLPLFV